VLSRPKERGAIVAAPSRYLISNIGPNWARIA